MHNRRNTLWLVLIVLLVAGLFTGQAVFFTLAVVFGGLMSLALVWSWSAVRGVSIGRRTRTRRSQVGRTFSETFTARNTFILPKLWLEIRDHSTLPGHRASYVVPSLWGRTQHQWRVESMCLVRGEFQLGPMTVISGDPFGLFLTPRRLDATQRIIIYPKIISLSAFQLPVGMLSGGEAQRYLTQHITTNAAGVREYVPGDSINRVHWKSTARRGKLIVKEFELDPLVDIWLLVDFDPSTVYEASGVQRLEQGGTVIPDNGQQIPASTEEYSVVVAASLASYFLNAERALGFAAYAPQREVYQPERGHRQLTRILETLAVARSHAERTLKEMLSLETPHLTRGATVLIVTASVSTDWLSEVQLLQRRGIRPMCIFVDPTSFGAAGSSDDVRGTLQMLKIPHIIIREGDNLKTVLEQRAF